MTERSEVIIRLGKPGHAIAERSEAGVMTERSEAGA
jgi:hypothetical protein